MHNCQVQRREQGNRIATETGHSRFISDSVRLRESLSLKYEIRFRKQPLPCLFSVRSRFGIMARALASPQGGSGKTLAQIPGSSQSRTQSLQAFWSAPERLWGHNLVPRVFRLFGQRGNAGKTLGTSNFITAGFLR